MSASTRTRPRLALGLGRSVLRLEAMAVAGVILVALLLVLSTTPDRLDAVPTIALGALGTLVLFGACGGGLALWLAPADWGPLVPLSAVPIGSASGSLALTALGILHIPLHVSLWIVLAAGLAGFLLVLRRARERLSAWRGSARGALTAAWLVVLIVVFCVALIPAWRSGQATIYGENPDSHQVAGIAVLFQHVPPTATDVRLPIDTVPPAWRFRYPIFYSLAGASNLAHMDPIRMFPAMAAVLVAMAALGFGALAVTCLRVPRAGGPLVAAAVGLAVVPLHLAWHPYWNQLWGFAVMPFVLLFGWQALERVDGRLAILCALMGVLLALAYPLALPDPLVILLTLAVAYRRRLRPRALLRSRSWIWAVVVVVLLTPAVVGAAIKLEQGVSQLLTPGGALWGGDVTHLISVGWFVGTGGGVIPALAVGAVAVLGLLRLPRPEGWAVGLGILALILVDVRVRLASDGAYMDFKQLSFVGALVLTLAAAGVAGLLARGIAGLGGEPSAFGAGVNRRPLIVAGAVSAAAIAWAAADAVQDHHEIVGTPPQVTPQMFEIRRWAARLPPGASVRVDIPASGVQLWAVYMLGAHPVSSPTPVLYTTYAHAPYGLRADYSLAPRYSPVPGPHGPRPLPPPRFTRDPPVAENSQFVLRRIVWPARLAATPQTASATLVEP